MGIVTPGITEVDKYIYIDGGAIRSAARKYAIFFKDTEVQINWEALRGQHQRAFYYDALPGGKNQNESIEQFNQRVEETRIRYDAMRIHEGLFVNYGVSYKRRKRVEQKRVDTMIAVDMLTHAQRGLIEEATILTNDQDFYPVIVAVMELGVKVKLICDSEKTNDEFMYISDKTTTIDLKLFHTWIAQDVRQEFSLPVEHHRMRSGSSNWSEGTLHIGKMNGGSWEFWDSEAKKSYVHNELRQLVSYCIVKYPDCDRLNTLLESIKIVGEAALPT